MDAWDRLEAEITDCRLCPRLVAWREETARVRRRAYRQQEYWGKPVAGFGDPHGRILAVGLAPGAHGANRTGRIFTGDSSGDFLYRALYHAGFASQPHSSRRGDGMRLNDLFISAVCRCAPPDNKPAGEEIKNCLPYLGRELALMNRIEGIVALGRIAFDNTLRLYRQAGWEIPRLEFGHAAFYRLGEGLPWMLASYHPSRQNTQTGRLTEGMFTAVWEKARELLG
ncbi:MAG: uracil-DNA glycosylase [Chloroflexi bacterium]|nr:uracil-DNA glycosylase [Chloroflexota bacterium]